MYNGTFQQALFLSASNLFKIDVVSGAGEHHWAATGEPPAKHPAMISGVLQAFR